MKKTILLLMFILSMTFMNKTSSQITLNGGWGVASIEDETFNGLELSGTYNFKNNVTIGLYLENLNKNIEGYDISLNSYGVELGYITSQWAYVYGRYGTSNLDVEDYGDADGSVIILGARITPWNLPSGLSPYIGVNYSFFNYDNVGDEFDGVRFSGGLTYTF